MVKGLDYFRDYFKGFENSYVLIGGVACDLAMDQAGLDFRATKDLDIVLCAEVIDAAFADKFWHFVHDGGYQHQEASTGVKQFYRFTKPTNNNFPFMLELFSRKPEGMLLNGHSHLTPIHVGNDVLSLSAILLDEHYYQCIEKGKIIIEGISILSPDYILPFKARAWLDLTERKAKGESVDSRNIKKHRNDVFKVFGLLAPTQSVEIAETIKADMRKFVAAMPTEVGLDIKRLGISTLTLEAVLANIELIYSMGQ